MAKKDVGVQVTSLISQLEARQANTGMLIAHLRKFMLTQNGHAADFESTVAVVTPHKKYKKRKKSKSFKKNERIDQVRELLKSSDPMSAREIGKKMGFKSVSGVHHILKLAVKNGLLSHQGKGKTATYSLS